MISALARRKGSVGYRPTGFQMIETVELRNFRSFGKADLKDCARINIVVGDNGSGKTALLEGIFLAAGPSPEIALRTRSWRGYDPERLRGTPDQVDKALWADLFHKFDWKKSASVSLRGSGDHNRSVKITYSDRKLALIAPNRKQRRAGVTPDEKPPIEFRWTVPGKNDVVINPRILDGQVQLPPISETLVVASFFAANRTYSSLETAQRFSDLRQTFEDEKFANLFKEQFKNVLDLSIGVSAGTPMLFGHISDLPERIPIGLASGGMNKLAAILVGLAAQPGGVILVDEIESGFYHKRLANVWESIRRLAVEYDSQVFASTHSAECLEAAAEIAEHYPKEFSVIRPVMEKGETKLRHFSGDNFINALSENIEIR
jgi:hypothetical protein